MAVKLNDLAMSFLSQLYEIITGGDAKVPASKHRFVSWCMPGIPFDAEDFTFAEKGLGGATTAEETQLFLQQAYNFSTLIDFIPDKSAVYDGDNQQTIYTNDGRRLSTIYGEILKLSKVTKDELSEEQKQKLKKFRDFLFETKKIKNIVTDVEEEVTEDGKVLKLYNQMESEYEEARLNYTSKMILAANASGKDEKGIVLDWAMNENMYYKKVSGAEKVWIAKGYKNEIDQINEYIRQTTQKSLKLWKGELQDFFKKGIRSTVTGEPFYYMQPIPGNFAKSKGWTTFSFDNTKVRKSTDYKVNQWNIGGGLKLNLGLFSIGGGGGGGKSSSDSSANHEVNDFSISFEFTQTLISRPWFYPEFFSCRGWTLGKEWDMQYTEKPSDGTIPSVGYGPFSLKLKGGKKKQAGSTDFESELTEETLTVPGMQIIGFVNHLIPKAPNSNPDLKAEDFE